MINAEEISTRCFLAGLPDTEAGKIIAFCARKKIRRIFSPHKFVQKWLLNPKRPQIELNEVIRKKEAVLEKEKNALTAAMDRTFRRANLNAAAVVKLVLTPKININNERNRILNQWNIR
jgi:hypothetical protein